MNITEQICKQLGDDIYNFLVETPEIQIYYNLSIKNISG
jgi:hypothetical protein